MFEEVPRGRRGLAGLSARRIVLGPFAIGGGVLLAAVGGSVAVAATVITASTIHVSDLPPKSSQRPGVVSSPAHSSHSVAAGRSASTGRSTPVTLTPSDGPVTLAVVPPATRSDQPSPSAATPSRTASSSPSGTASTATPTGSASSSPSGPAGNALIYVTGYDQTSHRLSYQFATVQRGAGPYGSDLYSVTAPEQFSAAIAAGITVTSGGQLCPPAGSRCTVAQLIEAAGKGFYANAAIDPSAAVQSILELDNVPAGSYAGPVSTTSPQPSPALSGSPQPSPSGTPTG